MSLPALEAPAEGSTSPVFYLSPELMIRKLQDDNNVLNKELAEAKETIGSLQFALAGQALQNRLFSMGIRLLARLLFSCDDRARYFAAQSGENNDESSVRKHWLRHGGKQAFKRDFPTEMHVIRYFIKSRAARALLRKIVEKTEETRKGKVKAV